VENPFRPPEAEKSLEPILGWRAWRLMRNSTGDLRIVPSTPRAAWEPREAVRATCSGSHTRLYMVFNPELAASHHSPEPGCTCGIHAVKDAARLARAGRSTAVVGRVAMWGRVIEHSKGYRAEQAYPSRLALVCAWCLWRGRMPAAPDRVVQRGTWLRPVCAEHSRRPTAVGRSTPANDVLQELLDTYGVDRLPEEMFRPLDDRRPGDLVTRLLRATDRGRTTRSA
jgi:hypothetical protein